jgi:hypothetical protein
MRREKAIGVIDKDEEGEKIKNNWVDGEVLHLVILKGEIDVKFAKNVEKKNLNFVFIL